MYSTNIKDERYSVKCLIVDKFIKPYKFIVDTGAKFTCCHYEMINIALTEHQMSGCEEKYIGGFVKGDAVKFYKYRIRQFTVGNIDMGTRNIWITFDRRVTDVVLGIDILKQMIMIINPYDQKVYFCKDKADYDKNFELLPV